MRKIETEARKAFFDAQRFRKGNVSIEISDYSKIGKVSSYYLFGNLIAEYFHETKLLKITDAGWRTNTTKGRLNSLLPHNYFIYQKKGIWYFNMWGKEEVFTGAKSIYL